MKQKTILDKDILFKDGQEIKLQAMQIQLIKILQDNVLHSYIELIEKLHIKRSWRETKTLRSHVSRINKLANLHIKPFKGLGFCMEDRIIVNGYSTKKVRKQNKRFVK